MEKLRGSFFSELTIDEKELDEGVVWQAISNFQKLMQRELGLELSPSVIEQIIHQSNAIKRAIDNTHELNSDLFLETARCHPLVQQLLTINDDEMVEVVTTKTPDQLRYEELLESIEPNIMTRVELDKKIKRVLKRTIETGRGDISTIAEMISFELGLLNQTEKIYEICQAYTAWQNTEMENKS